MFLRGLVRFQQEPIFANDLSAEGRLYRHRRAAMKRCALSKCNERNRSRSKIRLNLKGVPRYQHSDLRPPPPWWKPCSAFANRFKKFQYPQRVKSARIRATSNPSLLSTLPRPLHKQPHPLFSPPRTGGGESGAGQKSFTQGRSSVRASCSGRMACADQ